MDRTGSRPTWAEVDLAKIERNYTLLRQRAGDGVAVVPVVKADAYGHGAIPISRRLVKLGAPYLAIAIVEEGVALREAGIGTPILVLGGCLPGQEGLVVQHRLTPSAYRLDSLEQLSADARRQGAVIPFHLKVDTGMGRLGVAPQDVVAFLGRAGGLQGVRLEGMMTHLSSADEDTDDYTNMQLARFQQVLRAIEEAGFQIKWRHAANSAGTVFHPGARFNMVRVGLALYGINPNPKRGDIGLEPVLSFRTSITYLKHVPAGTPLGYSRTFVTKSESVIATVPVGYADGLNRLLSNRGRMIVRGRLAPIVGRVSMDLTLLDVTAVPDVALGDEAIIIGKSGGVAITAADVAQQTGTIPYEVTCQISKRVPRVCVG